MSPKAGAARRWLLDHWVVVTAVLVVLAVGVGFGFRLTLLRDEAYSLSTAQRALPETVRQALTFELQPPLYFVLLNLWLRVSPAIPWARMLSVIAVVLTVIVLDRYGRIWGGKARLLPLFAAISPVLLWAESTIRGYALASLGVALSLLLFWELWLTDRPPRPARVVAFVAAAYGSVLTFYYCGFVIAAMFLAGVLLRPRARSFWIAFAALALLTVPWLTVVREQAAIHPLYGQSPVDRSGGVPGALVWAFGAALDGMLGGVSLLARPGARVVVTGAALAVVLGRLSSLRALPWTRGETALVLISAVPAAILAGLRWSNTFLVDVRHWVPVAVVMVTCAVVLASRCEPRRLQRALLGSIMLIIVASAVSRLRNRWDVPDFAAALAWMRDAGDEPQWPIFISRGSNALVLRHYAENRVVAIPREASLRHPAEDQMIRDVAEVAGPIEARVAPGARYWYLRETNLAPFGEAVLDDYLRRHATILRAHDTAQLRIQLLQRSPDGR